MKFNLKIVAISFTALFLSACVTVSPSNSSLRLNSADQNVLIISLAEAVRSANLPTWLGSNKSIPLEVRVGQAEDGEKTAFLPLFEADFRVVLNHMYGASGYRFGVAGSGDQERLVAHVLIYGVEVTTTDFLGFFSSDRSARTVMSLELHRRDGSKSTRLAMAKVNLNDSSKSIGTALSPLGAQANANPAPGQAQEGLVSSANENSQESGNCRWVATSKHFGRVVKQEVGEDGAPILYILSRGSKEAIPVRASYVIRDRKGPCD